MNSVPQTHFLVYKITNKLDGKTYIGCHKTKNPDDSYMGSGKYLKRAQAKHGLENFKKEILFDFNNSKDMFEKEKQLISEINPDYNLHEGGLGGWEYVNSKRSRADSIKYGLMAADKNKKTSAKRRDDNVKKYLSIKKMCQNCGTGIGYVKRYNKFCSRSCSAKYHMSRPRTMSEASRRKISNSLREFYVDRKKYHCECGVNIKKDNKSGRCLKCIRLRRDRLLDIGAITDMRYNRGMTLQSIADHYGVSHPTIINRLKSHGLADPPRPIAI